MPLRLHLRGLGFFSGVLVLVLIFLNAPGARRGDLSVDGFMTTAPVAETLR